MSDSRSNINNTVISRSFFELRALTSRRRKMFGSGCGLRCYNIIVQDCICNEHCGIYIVYACTSKAYPDMLPKDKMDYSPRDICRMTFCRTDISDKINKRE